MSHCAVLDQLGLAPSQWIDLRGVQVPAAYSSVEEEYWALKEAAGWMDLSHRGKLLVRGKDAPRFLHGMVSNEIKELPPGRGTYAFFLDVHGHIQADARILRLDAESFHLDCDGFRLETIRQTLEKYIIADDVEVVDPPAAQSCLAIEGPCALELLREAIGFEPPHMLPLEHLEVPELNLRLARASISGEFGYWIWGPGAQLAGVWTQAAQAGAVLGGRAVGHQAAEICRIEAGIPRYGAEIDDKTLPQETGRLNAISYTKGCYLGQEIVERVRSRGHVNRLLARLEIDSDTPPAQGEKVVAQGNEAGEITSAAWSPALEKVVALAWMRAECVRAEEGLTVESASARIAASAPLAV